MDPIVLIIVFLIGIIASFVNGLVGGGGSLISIPALIILGLPPQIAIATNRLGLLGNSTSSIVKFVKAKKIVTKYLIPLSIFGLVGSVLGAQFLIEINEGVLEIIIAILMIILLPLTLMKKSLGLKQIITTQKQRTIGYGLFFLTGIYGGFFGAGAGLFSIFILVFLFGLTYIEANATEKVPWFLSILITTIIFALYGLINFVYGIVLLAGMLIGGYPGAHIAVIKGNKFVRIIFVVVVIALAAKLVLF